MKLENNYARLKITFCSKLSQYIFAAKENLVNYSSKFQKNVKI